MTKEEVPHVGGRTTPDHPPVRASCHHRNKTSRLRKAVTSGPSPMSVTLSLLAAIKRPVAHTSNPSSFPPPHETPLVYVDDDQEPLAEHDMSPHVVGILGFSMYGLLCFIVL